MDAFPEVLKTIENKSYMLKIEIMRSNVEKKCRLFKVTDVFETSTDNESETMEESITEVCKFLNNLK